MFHSPVVSTGYYSLLLRFIDLYVDKYILEISKATATKPFCQLSCQSYHFLSQVSYGKGLQSHLFTYIRNESKMESVAFVSMKQDNTCTNLFDTDTLYFSVSKYFMF